MCFKPSLSRLEWQRCACTCLCVCGCVLVWPGAPSCILFLPHFILCLRGHWQSCPWRSNYFMKQRCFLWHEAFQKIPPNYACHASWSCPPWQHDPTKWFMVDGCHTSDLTAIHAVVQGGLILQNNRYWYDIHPSTLFTVNSHSGMFTAWLVSGLQEALLHQRLKGTVGKTN